jgi:hypothetical protein
MVDVVVYVSSVANFQKHTRKTQCLESFAAGVSKLGHSVVLETAHRYTPSRLAVMLGWATTNTGGPNIVLRKEIIAQQRRHGFHTMCIDASCWKYLDNASSYLRYSLDGPFYDRAEYANRNSDSSKWQEISQALGISLAPPQTNPGGHILICMQRDGGFAMKALDPVVWLTQKIAEIRRHTDRTIMVRPHPGAYKPTDFLQFRTRHYQTHLGVHVFDPVILEWWDLSNSTHGKPPSPRCKFGIAAASGRLYIFGGASPSTGFAFFPASFVDANGQTRFPVAKSLLFSVQCLVTHV